MLVFDVSNGVRIGCETFDDHTFSEEPLKVQLLMCALGRRTMEFRTILYRGDHRVVVDIESRETKASP